MGVIFTILVRRDINVHRTIVIAPWSSLSALSSYVDQKINLYTSPSLFDRSYCPRLSRKLGTLKLIRLSVCLSVCHKNFNLAHIFWSINDRALIFGMHDPCDKTFQLTSCLDLDLWPTSRSKLLPGGGPQFFKFGCYRLTTCMLSSENSCSRELGYDRENSPHAKIIP